MKRIATALLLVACSKGSPSSSSSAKPTSTADHPDTASAPEKAPTKPLDGSWEDGGVKYTFKGGSFTTITSESGLTLVFDTAPKGSHYKLGDKSGTIDGADTVVDVPFPTPLDKIPVSGAVSMGAKIDPKMSLHLVLPDGRGGDIPLQPVDVSELVRSTLKKSVGKALTFPGEATDAAPKDSLIYLSTSPRVFGKNGDLGNVDFVASGILTPETKGTSSCEFTNESTGKAVTLTMNLHEWKVTIYERRTGNVVDTKTFAPSTECPMFSMTSDGQKTIDNEGNDDAAAEWLAQRTGLDEIPSDQLMQL